MSEKTMDAEAGVVAIILIAPIIMVMLVPAMLWQGWAAAILWAWFIVPVFSLPAISISQAAGVMLVLGCLRFKLSSPKDDTSWSTKLIALLIGPPIAVSLGWLVKWTAL